MWLREGLLIRRSGGDSAEGEVGQRGVQQGCSGVGHGRDWGRGAMTLQPTFPFKKPTKGGLALLGSSKGHHRGSL